MYDGGLLVIGILLVVLRVIELFLIIALVVRELADSRSSKEL